MFGSFSTTNSVCLNVCFWNTNVLQGTSGSFTKIDLRQQWFLLRVVTIVIGFILTLCNLLFSWGSWRDSHMNFISKQMLLSMKWLTILATDARHFVWSTAALETVIKYKMLSTNYWWVYNPTLCEMKRKEKEKCSKKVEWSHVVLTAPDKRNVF